MPSRAKPTPRRQAGKTRRATLTRDAEGSRNARRLVAKRIEQAIAAHPCGPCNACCTVKEVSELGKPEYVACEHLRSSETRAPCGIYKDRPNSCVEYFCGWRYGLLGNDSKLRPDQLGLLFDPAGASPPGVLMLSVREVTPGSIEAHMGVLNELSGKRGYVFYLVRGEKRHFLGPEEKVRACQEWSKRHLPLVAR